MRPPPRILLEAAVAVAEFSGTVHFSPPPLSTSPPPTPAPCVAHACRWWPYSGSKEFEANAAMVLIILLSALICALGLNAAIRCFLRGTHLVEEQLDRRSSSNPTQTHHELARVQLKTNAAAAPCFDGGPTLVYSPEMKAELAGAAAECAICLSEFVDGEGIRVLERCKHGFHAHCIQAWLSSHSSCPTCRRTCLPPSPPHPHPHPPPPQSTDVEDQPPLTEIIAP
ncbi:putative transcription factor C2H2 family [Rosa chinensis]|uniref:RING-type E3 ubiquitin transferase n=1 Tax=Rosa chinensis TaxID=74649 RepID=A0A2P6P4D1_ROSCH|nr:RING-H2 finger protein ATL79 [Rosa chinensis]PRQ16791.1 putative transcription factor C2H2 family [Rosa chinensis]